eukprot:COSAG05_NODE_953_length_6443_cov_14.987390_11_plen_78_part_00
MLLLLLAPLWTAVGYPAGTRPELPLRWGVARGTALSDGVEQFLGIPYAEPPVHELRWVRESCPPTCAVCDWIMRACM